MGKRVRRSVLRAALAATAAALIACSSEPPPPPEQIVHDGRTAQQWYASIKGAPDAESALADLVSGGPDAVPMFLDVAEHYPDAPGLALPSEAARFGKESIPAFRDALGKGSMRHRAAAALSLAQFGDDALATAPAMAAVLVDASAAGDHHAAGFVREALRLLGPGANEATAQAARDENVREVAMDILVEHSRLSVPALEELVRSKDPALASEAGDQLAVVRSRAFPLHEWSSTLRSESRRLLLPHDQRAIDVLDLEEDDREELHLESMSVGDALPYLLRTAADPPGPRTRRRAMGVLRLYGPEAAPAVPHSLDMFSSPDAFDRITAAGLAAAVGPDAEATVPLLAAMFDENLERTRLFAAWAMGRMGRKGAPCFERLQSMWDDRSGGFLRDEDPRARHHLGAMGMANVDPARAIPILAAALDDAEWSRRRSALEALAVAGTPAVETLARTLQDGSPRARAAAALALHYMGDQDLSAWIALARAADDPEPAVRALGEEARRATEGLDGAF